MKKPLQTVGWREWLSLPDLGVRRIKAKVDTGARTSSLHAFDLQVRTQRGRDIVHFGVHPIQRSARGAVSCTAPLHDERYVTSSSGKRELRPVIVTRLAWFDTEWLIEVTLTSRDVMGFRMLLGREAIRDRCLVDPGRSYFAGRPRKKRPVRKKRVK